MNHYYVLKNKRHQLPAAKLLALVRISSVVLMNCCKELTISGTVADFTNSAMVGGPYRYLRPSSNQSPCLPVNLIN